MRISVSEINPTTIKRYFSQRQNITTNYLRRKANDAKIDTNGLKLSEKAMVTANKWQGEHFNNAVTAIGTAGVAPIFIINNPLAKEDKATKKYTAARQPISAVITLAGQVPIMMAYNRMLDKYVTEHRLDRCDLHAAPPLSYYKDLVNSQTRKFLLENPELMGELSKDDIRYIKSLYYDKEKNNAFFDELRKIRTFIHSSEPLPKEGKSKARTLYNALAKCIDNDKKFNIDYLISPNDYEFAEKQILQNYMANNHDIVFNEKGKIVKINGKDIESHLQKEIKTVSDLKKGGVKKILKDFGLEIGKDEYKALKRAITPDVIKEQAKSNVENEIKTKAKIKFQFAQLAREAKKALMLHKLGIMKQGLSDAEIAAEMERKNYELFEGLVNKAKVIFENAPEDVPKGSSELRKREAQILFDKLKDKLENAPNPSKKDSLKTREKLKALVYDCFDGEIKVEFLKTDGRETLEDTIKDQQAKKWLTTRINNSQKVLKNFKQISGLIVGLGILPITCGVLNWAYPRIMEEFFPKLAHAKAETAKVKEAK